MKKFGLIGYPLGHSFSKNFFNEKFQSEKIDAEYVNFEIPDINDFPAILTSNPDLEGLNVTIPYKEQVMHYLNNIAPEAISIGAVNVIKIERNKGKIKLTGYNSDVTGFTQSIEPLLEPYHKKALILGTGGASKAVNYGLKQLGLSTLFVSRNHHNDTIITYEELTPEIKDEIEIIARLAFDEEDSTLLEVSDCDTTDELLELSVFDIAGLLAKKIESDLQISVTFKPIELEVTINY